MIEKQFSAFRTGDKKHFHENEYKDVTLKFTFCTHKWVHSKH